jgi:large subunit ribosomal protein L22
MVEVIAQLNNLRMSPKKVRLVTDSIKGLDVNSALMQLKFIQKRSAPIVIKLLQSAVANAKHDQEIELESLVIKNITVNQALSLKRWQPAAHGAAHPFKKHGSHIRLVLSLKPGVKAPTVSKSAVKGKALIQDTVKVDKPMKAKAVHLPSVKLTGQDQKTNLTKSKPAGKKSITRTTSK